jgi:nucleotide-binding universal stress UspA family protein
VLLPLEAGQVRRVPLAVAGALKSLWGETPALRILHVGERLDPARLPRVPGFELELRQRRGETVAAIADEASDVDLVVMPSRGHLTWLDDLRGSTTERVLRQIDCPLLEIPV